MWRPRSQPVGKAFSALSLISHSLLSPDALPGQVKQLSLRTQMQEILGARAPQGLGLGLTPKRED